MKLFLLPGDRAVDSFFERDGGLPVQFAPGLLERRVLDRVDQAVGIREHELRPRSSRQLDDELGDLLGRAQVVAPDVISLVPLERCPLHGGYASSDDVVDVAPTAGRAAVDVEILAG